ncbi:hypothetical protein QAD02_005898 [Eretmocerus hayati]|uniref:Uncharacterized protein n=1 Tax=Eretmocerus hayati TaxID=131215 RepID=A0ACC2MZY4_9HYME|nr:hypothetical protein QAD02_005898 [Eretmocerus hayati]
MRMSTSGTNETLLKFSLMRSTIPVLHGREKPIPTLSGPYLIQDIIPRPADEPMLMSTPGPVKTIPLVSWLKPKSSAPMLRMSPCACPLEEQFRFNCYPRRCDQPSPYYMREEPIHKAPHPVLKFAILLSHPAFWAISNPGYHTETRG